MDFEKLPQIGDQIEVVGSGRDDRMSIVTRVCPYTGRYPELFTHVVRYTALNTRCGHLDMAVNVLSHRGE